MRVGEIRGLRRDVGLQLQLEGRVAIFERADHRVEFRSMPSIIGDIRYELGDGRVQEGGLSRGLFDLDLVVQTPEGFGLALELNDEEFQHAQEGLFCDAELAIPRWGAALRRVAGHDALVGEALLRKAFAISADAADEGEQHVDGLGSAAEQMQEAGPLRADDLRRLRALVVPFADDVAAIQLRLTLANQVEGSQPCQRAGSAADRAPGAEACVAEGNGDGVVGNNHLHRANRLDRARQAWKQIPDGGSATEPDLVEENQKRRGAGGAFDITKGEIVTHIRRGDLPRELQGVMLRDEAMREVLVQQLQADAHKRCRF